MTPMRLLMLGAPGAGKGTQASGLAARFGLEHIASGALLRREVRDGTPLGRHVGSYLDRGDLIPDDLMLDVIGPRVAAASGFVLDGFPRSLAQQRAAERRGLFDERPLDAAVFLEVTAGVAPPLARAGP
jgi:adenylate kinase